MELPIWLKEIKLFNDLVSNLIENQKTTEKNLIELDKKLSELFKNDQSEKASVSNASKRGSKMSVASSRKGSEKSNRSAFARAGLNISSQERSMSNSYYRDSKRVPMHNRTANLNKTHVSPKNVDEWDNIIMNDVKKFEEEQKLKNLNKQQLKRQVMDDLNKQINEKKRLLNREKQLEIELEKKRQNVHLLQEKKATQAEIRKTWKNQEERKIMETQIAEVENMKKLEQYNELSRAKAEKEQASKALEDDLTREKRKKQQYQEVCQKQYHENLEMKDYLKKKEHQRLEDESLRKKDMFGDMFEEKKHVSYEYAARNQKKFDALNKVLEQENIRKNRVKNYAEFEEGVNSLERKNILSTQLKENRLKENLKVNRNYLEEQINFRKKQEKFEKDINLNQAKQMNLKAQEELERDAQRQQQQRIKRIEHTNQLKTQMDFKPDPYANMTEQERRMNKEKLEV